MQTETDQGTYNLWLRSPSPGPPVLRSSTASKNVVLRLTFHSAMNKVIHASIVWLVNRLAGTKEASVQGMM